MNVVNWLYQHVPKLLLILAGLVAAQFVVRRFSQRIVKFMSRQAIRGSLKERENRVDTLVDVFRNTAAVALVLVAALMILDEVGIRSRRSWAGRPSWAWRWRSARRLVT